MRAAARRFVGDYELHGESASCTASCAKKHLLSWDELGRSLRVRPVATPDQNVAEALRQCEPVFSRFQDPRADVVARMAGETGLRRRRDSPTLEANYLRRTRPRFWSMASNRESSAQVRPAPISDLNRIFEIERATPHCAHWPQSDYESALAAASPRRLLLVVECDAQVEGFLVARSCWFGILLRKWEIENLVVAETARRRGLAALWSLHFWNRSPAQGGGTTSSLFTSRFVNPTSRPANFMKNPASVLTTADRRITTFPRGRYRVLL